MTVWRCASRARVNTAAVARDAVRATDSSPTRITHARYTSPGRIDSTTPRQPPIAESTSSCPLSSRRRPERSANSCAARRIEASGSPAASPRVGSAPGSRVTGRPAWA
ncbi:hypothetical protein ACJ65_04980 [Kocuria rhizophila]|nr:hypothetical protein ACJ65_04980 [Kocuria rhizophila]KUP27999.1 hypothetical protein IX41_03815 [Kocuria rhizophila]